MVYIAEIDDREISLTPVFKIIEVENVPKSETAGYAVMEMIEGVEVRFAGQKNYSPFFPSDAFWKREGNKVFTYAERWPDQFRAFKEGNPQEANGTPLEMLRPYGITPEQLSLCRALRIYSIEALHALEGQGVKNLGMNSNKLKDAARAWTAERDKNLGNYDEIESLKAEIAALRAAMPLPIQEPTPAQVEQAIQIADDQFEAFSDDEIKVWITDATGARPKGNPSRATLLNIARELAA